MGQIGLSNLPNEQRVIDVLRNAVGSTDGLYVFPSMDLKGSMDGREKLATNPRFPTSDTLSYMAIEIVSFAVCRVVAASILKRD